MQMYGCLLTLTHTNTFPKLEGPGSNNLPGAMSTLSINNQVPFLPARWLAINTENIPN